MPSNVANLRKGSRVMILSSSCQLAVLRTSKVSDMLPMQLKLIDCHPLMESVTVAQGGGGEGDGGGGLGDGGRGGGGLGGGGLGDGRASSVRAQCEPSASSRCKSADGDCQNLTNCIF